MVSKPPDTWERASLTLDIVHCVPSSVENSQQDCHAGNRLMKEVESRKVPPGNPKENTISPRKQP